MNTPQENSAGYEKKFGPVSFLLGSISFLASFAFPLPGVVGGLISCVALRRPTEGDLSDIRLNHMIATNPPEDARRIERGFKFKRSCRNVSFPILTGAILGAIVRAFCGDAQSVAPRSDLEHLRMVQADTPAVVRSADALGGASLSEPSSPQLIAHPDFS